MSFLQNPEDVSDKEKLVTKEQVLPQRSQNWERLGDGNLTLSRSKELEIKFTCNLWETKYSGDGGGWGAPEAHWG